MVCESDTGYLLRFIVYTGASTFYQEPVEELYKQFNDYTNTSKVVLSLLRGFYNKSYCVTLDNFYTSPEIAKELLSLETDCYGTLRKKQDLPSDFWQWKPVKGELPIAKYNGNILVSRWSDVTKTKSVKIVSMLWTIHANILADSGKINRETNEPIRKPEVIVNYNKTMGGVDLVSRVIIPYNSQRRRVKWYRKLAELFIEVSVYHFQKTGSWKQYNDTFIISASVDLLLPATQNKARAQRKFLRCSKLGIRRDTRFWCSKCEVALCFLECFEVYHTFKDFTKSLSAAHDSADESDY